MVVVKPRVSSGAAVRLPSKILVLTTAAFLLGCPQNSDPDRSRRISLRLWGDMNVGSRESPRCAVGDVLRPALGCSRGQQIFAINEKSGTETLIDSPALRREGKALIAQYRTESQSGNLTDNTNNVPEDTAAKLRALGYTD